MRGGTAPRRWVGGLLRTARAAAFLTLATGINGTVAAIYPRYEPIYVYLIAIVVITWLGGVLLGVSAAVAAVICYDWMFSPVQVVPSLPSVLPLLVAIAAAVVTRLAKMPPRRQEVAAAPTPVLLPPIDATLQPEVRRQPDPELIASYERRISDARRVAETEARLRAEAAAATRLREAQLANDIEALRNTATDQATKVANARHEVEAAAQKVREAELRANALNQELEVAYRKADEEKSRADREARLREQLEVAGHESLQKTITELSSKYETALAASNKRSEALQKELDRVSDDLLRLGAARDKAATAAKEAAGTTMAEMAKKYAVIVSELNERLRAASARAEELARQHEQEGASTASLRGHLAELERRVAAESTRAEEEKGSREKLAREFNARLQQIGAALRDARAEKEAADSAIRALRAQVEQLSKRRDEQQELTIAAEVEQLRNDLAGERKRVEDQKAERAALARAFDQRLQQTIAAITTDYEEKIAGATVQRDAAHVEVRELTRKLEALRADLAQAREELDSVRQGAAEGEALRQRMTQDFDNKLQQIVASITTDYEENIGEAIVQREAARAEVRDLTNELHANSRKYQEDLDAVRQQLNKEFDDTLQKIVASITLDHEESMGEAIVQREAARAQVRELTKELEAFSKKQKEDLETLRAELEVAKSRAAADDVAAVRQQLNKEFDDKLQRIVASITTDYEENMGDAIVQREAARAEVRELTKELESAKSRAEKLDLEWSEKLNKIVAHLATDHEHDLGEAMLEKEAAKAEARRLTTRVNIMQQKLEQERETFRLARDRWNQERTRLLEQAEPFASPPVEGAPIDPSTIAILVAHSDAGVRAMARHALEQTGYTVFVAADGLEAMRTAAMYKPDVLVAEALMPKMNGHELVQLLKSRPQTANMKIIILGTDLDRGSDFRADDLIHDAADFNALRAALTKVLSTKP